MSDRVKASRATHKIQQIDMGSIVIPAHAYIDNALENGSPTPPALSDANGWNQPQFYSTIQCADIDGDGEAELLARSAGGIQAWEYDDINTYWNNLPNGPALSDVNGWNQPQFYSTIQCADIDGDGEAEMLARSSGGIQAWKYATATSTWNNLANGPALSDANGWNQAPYYSTIQCADIDGDGQAELIARSSGGIEVWEYDPNTALWSNLPNGPALSDVNGWNQPQFYSTIQCADIDGDGQDELIARSSGGIQAWKCDKISSVWSNLPNGPALSDVNGWNQPQYYATIQCADIDGDGQAELIARSSGGIQAWKYDGATSTWNNMPNGPGLSDANGWNQPQYYSTIQCADIDGDGQAELIARSAGGIQVWKYDGATSLWNNLPNGPAMSDANGWNQPQYYTTIQFADINNDGLAELLARDPGGMVVYHYDVERGNVWETFPGLGPIPQPTQANIAIVQASLTNMDDFVNQFHDFFQDKIELLYQLSQVTDNDPGQAFANQIIGIAFKAIGAAPIPGAGAISGVLGGIFTYVSTDNPLGNLNQIFANVWDRFSTNLMDTKTQIATYNSNTAANWTTSLTNQATGETTVLADLVNSPFPASATQPFNTIFQLSMTKAEYALWQSVLPQRWNNVSLLNPSDLHFQSEQECRTWIESYVNTNENYNISYYESDATWPSKGKVWRVNENWLGYGWFPYGHHNAPAALCTKLFQDDGLGNIVRPSAITTRADVFNNWGLSVQEVVMPSYSGPQAATTALAISHATGVPVQLAGLEMTGIVLQKRNLAMADLSGVIANQGQFAKSDPSGANLINAQMRDSDLAYTTLIGTQCSGADLNGARLEFADATGADLSLSDLSGALALGMRARAANLSHATLTKTALRGADLREADLTYADLTGADLAGADLRGAKLGNAILTRATLRGADLTGADLSGATMEGAETTFTHGLSMLWSGKAARPVRCLAARDTSSLDAVTFLKVSQAFADMLDMPLMSGYGQMVENFETAINTFAMFGVPLSTPNPAMQNMGLTLNFGTGGPAVYQQVAQQMGIFGVNPDLIPLLGQMGEIAGYCPFNFRNSITDMGVDIHVGFQGPMGLTEVNALLNQAGQSAMEATVQAASTALDVASVMLTSVDFSLSQPAHTEVTFVIPAGNTAAIPALLTALNIDWQTAGTIDQWLARTTTPYLVSVGSVTGISGYEIGIYLPYEAERNVDVNSLLDDAGRNRFLEVEAFTTQYPLTLAYVGVIRDPDGTISIAAQVAFD